MHQPLPRSISYPVIGWCVVGLLITACGTLGSLYYRSGSGQISLRSTGATPSSLYIGNGGTVVFNAVDGTRHEIYSGPHPEHTACPVLNIGALGPPAKKNTKPFPTGVCQFHDDVSPDDARFHGTIQVK